MDGPKAYGVQAWSSCSTRHQRRYYKNAKITKCIINNHPRPPPLFDRCVHTSKSSALWVLSKQIMLYSRFVLYHILAGWLVWRIQYVRRISMDCPYPAAQFGYISFFVVVAIVVVVDVFCSAPPALDWRWYIILSVLVFVVGLFLSFVRIVESQPAKLDWDDARHGHAAGL